VTEQTAVVVTSISAPNAALAALATGCRERGHRFLVIGDAASPPQFELAGCDFFGLARQQALEFAFARRARRATTRARTSAICSPCNPAPRSSSKPTTTITRNPASGRRATGGSGWPSPRRGAG
jgi:hypothetical protein